MKIVCIGAGLSGLSAVYHLHQQLQRCKDKVEIIVVEAQDYLGGRVWTHPKGHFENLPNNKRLELGAEFLHGNNSLFNEFVEQKMKLEKVMCFDLDTEQKKLPKHQQQWLLFHNNQLATYDAEKCKELDEAISLIGEDRPVQLQHPVLKKILEDPKKDVTLQEYLTLMKVPKEHFAIADSMFSKTQGTHIAIHGLKGTIVEEQEWDYGTKNYHFKEAYSPKLIDYLSREYRDKIKLNWPVGKIQFKHNKATIVKKHSTEMIENVDYVIITVPLAVLKTDMIQFEPKLPQWKTNAIQKMQMLPGLKVIVKFRTQFWRKLYSGLKLVFVTEDPYIAQLWMPIIEPYSDGREAPGIVVGFAIGDAGVRITNEMKSGKITEEKLLHHFVRLLERVFGQELMTQYEEGHTYNWAENPYILGSYSHSGLHCETQRQELAKSVDNRLFFAGEATTAKAFATVQGAMESGKRVAEEIIKVAHNTPMTSKM